MSDTRSQSRNQSRSQSRTPSRAQQSSSRRLSRTPTRARTTTSPKIRTKRSANSWTLFNGYISNAVGAKTGEAPLINDFNDLARKEYPYALESKSRKVSKSRDDYRERAEELKEKLREIDPQLIESAERVIKALLRERN